MKYMRSVLCGLGLLLAAAATPAQEARVKAQIPFDFVVGNQVLPAGEYAVVPEGNAQALWIRSDQAKESAMTLTIACTNSGPATSSRLVFHVVDGRYFLSQVWAQGYDQGRQLPRSKMEQQLAKNNSTEEFVLAANLTN